METIVYFDAIRAISNTNIGKLSLLSTLRFAKLKSSF